MSTGTPVKPQNLQTPTGTVTKKQGSGTCGYSVVSDSPRSYNDHCHFVPRTMIYHTSLRRLGSNANRDFKVIALSARTRLVSSVQIPCFATLLLREPHATVKLLEGLEQRPTSCCHNLQQIDTFGGGRRGARGPAGATLVNRRVDAGGLHLILHHVGKALHVCVWATSACVDHCPKNEVIMVCIRTWRHGSNADSVVTHIYSTQTP